MLISTKQRAQSIQLLPDKNPEITSINSSSAYSNRSSSPRSSCSSTSSSSNSSITTDNNNNNTNNIKSVQMSSDQSSTDERDHTKKSVLVTETTLETDADNNGQLLLAADEVEATEEEDNVKAENTSINENEDELLEEDNDCEDESQESVVDVIYDYWKNFDIQKLKNDLNEQIDEILQHQTEHEKLNVKYSQLNEDLEKSSTEDILNTVKSFQQELAESASRCKLTERTSIDLFKLIASVPDPFRAIELAKSQLQEQGPTQCEQIERLRTENTELKRRLKERNEPSESAGGDNKSELVYHLSEQVGRTTQLNLELTSKLKLAEGEIDSYKRILAEYQNEISDMKVKHLNEIKSEYHKDSDKTKSKIDSISEATNNKAISGINNSSLSATSTSSKSDKLTNLSDSNKSLNTAAFKPIEANNNENTTKMTANDTAYDSANEEFDENECDESLLHHTQKLGCESPIHTSATASANANNSNNFEPINTADIAQKVRDLLSIHNIGQRVFAKFILGLSQGTVSELLSKPKHWDKLTEKGRESYRKMYNWSCSEQSISTLKAISPRKGNKDNYFYQSNGVVKEEPSTEDRISQILSEAQKQMSSSKQNQQLANLSGSPSPSNSSAISPSNTDGSPSMSPNAHQDLLQRMLLNTYNNNVNANNNNGYENDEETEADESMNEEDLSQYHRKPQNHKRSNDESFPLDLTTSRLPTGIHNKSAMEINCKKVKTERHELMESDDGENSVECNNKPNKNFNFRNNKTTSNNNAALNASPLKHIQSIADAYLISQLDQANSAYKNFQQQSPSSTNSFQRPSSTPSPSLSNSGNAGNVSHPSGGGSKALKSILPPVSQEQFDRYSFINTEELVKKVKDLLSKFSISQRLFGECILGLSQGSVSDLLARPKPWQMLTQKGREPFIRMQMFIDDPEAIKKLMANQYKGPAEHKANHSSRSNSSHSLLNGSSNPTFDTAKDSLQKIVSQTLSQNLNGLQNAQSLSAMFANISHTQNLLNLSQQQFQQAAIAAAAASAVNAASVNSNSTNNDNSNDSEVKTTNQFQTQINIIPYDISTMSAVNDLNTEEITNRVKETLLNNNIGQKLFGEAVLNLSQGTVSELLSKPKPWNTLSIKGREPYLRMYMWLNDLMRLEKLTEWKEEKNLLKRNSTEVESDHQKPKRRFIFSEEQKEQLMKAFKYDPYPAVNQMEALANKLNLQTRTVINWFHNHRMRIRYKNSTSQASSSATSTTNNSAHNENNHITQVTSRSRSTNQFNEFTKSLPHFSNTNKNNNNNRSSSSNRNNNSMINNSHLANSFYANQFSNSSRNNEEEYDDEEYNNIDESESQKDVESDLEPTRTKAALALLNNAYNLPKYFSTHKQQYENEHGKHDISEMEDDEDDEELETNENNQSLQDDLEDTDPEAEINSMYIPGNGENHQEYDDGEEDPEELNQNNNNIYMSPYASSPSETSSSRQNQLITNSNTNNNKRRKPHNPQKISFALNLLNSKLQKQQQQQQRAAVALVGTSDDQDMLNE